VITPVALALVAHNGCYLVGRRGPNAPLAGFCEFPGGKCLPGETPKACAVRECLEETGLRVEVVRLRYETQHTYPYGSVHLHFFDCRLARESDPAQVDADFVWVPRRELPACQFPEPNQTVVTQLIGESDQ
jgi:mutator protein MutT